MLDMVSQKWKETRVGSGAWNFEDSPGKNKGVREAATQFSHVPMLTQEGVSASPILSSTEAPAFQCKYTTSSALHNSTETHRGLLRRNTRSKLGVKRCNNRFFNLSIFQFAWTWSSDSQTFMIYNPLRALASPRALHCPVTRRCKLKTWASTPPHRQCPGIAKKIQTEWTFVIILLCQTFCYCTQPSISKGLASADWTNCRSEVLGDKTVPIPSMYKLISSHCSLNNTV